MSHSPNIPGLGSPAFCGAPCSVSVNRQRRLMEVAAYTQISFERMTEILSHNARREVVASGYGARLDRHRYHLTSHRITTWRVAQ
jgi:hypothetical protein